MANKKNQTNAVEILRNRYIGEDPEKKASLREERVSAEVARTIFELRKESGLSQKNLAELINTTQSVISRLEDADYEGHSLSMLSRIAKALNHKLSVQITAKDPKIAKLRYVFSEVVKRLRKEKGLSIEEFAKKSGIDTDEALALEQDVNYKPAPLILHKLSKFYKIPERRIYSLAGAVKEIPDELNRQAIQFAAKSESFSKLTIEEKRILEEFVKYLRTEDL